MLVMRKQLDQQQLPLAEIKRRCARRDHCAPLPLAFYISPLRVASALALSFFFFFKFLLLFWFSGYEVCCSRCGAVRACSPFTRC